jgi:hypothetical protein
VEARTCVSISEWQARMWWWIHYRLHVVFPTHGYVVPGWAPDLAQSRSRISKAKRGHDFDAYSRVEPAKGRGCSTR